ncbi:unnamed protein product [Camellia sinensis]
MRALFSSHSRSLVFHLRTDRPSQSSLSLRQLSGKDSLCLRLALSRRSVILRNGIDEAKSSGVWTTVKPFVNGGASTMLATCVIQPIDVIKVTTNADESMKKFILAFVGKKWREWKARVKKNGVYAIHRPERVHEHQWRSLVYYWGTRKA